MVGVSFSVYDVNIILYFDIWLYFINLEILTRLDVKHSTEQCGNAHPFII